LSFDPLDVPPVSNEAKSLHVVDPRDFGIGKLFDVIREAAVVADARTERIVLWNHAAQAIFGYDEAEALQLPLHALVPQSHRDKHRAGIARYATTGHGELIDKQTVLELPALKKDGSEIMIEFSLTPVDRSEGDHRYALAIIRDVTERVTLDRLKNDFVAMVAHDLRSPMSVIAGFAETLDKRWDRLPAEQRTLLLEGISRNVYSLDHLVEDVLQVARLESGQFSYEMEPFDLGALIERTAGETSESNAGQKIELDVPPSLPLARGDELRNWQILTNLLSNAFKFSASGRPVKVTVTVLADALKVEVIDRGVGIAGDDVDRLFNKFSRVSQSGGKAGGTGLGLYICRLMVEAQGGSIGVASEPGEGSTFYYTIPRAP
jgi:PAS domain S-box-containing protein